MTKAMLIDTSICIGCKGCQVACKEWWNLAPTKTTQVGTYENPLDLNADTWTRIRFSEYEAGGKVRWLFMKWGCMQCANAACVDVCPTAALKKNALGFVSLERDLCNGCGYCSQACPFNIPRLETINALTGEAKATKCTFCQDRITNDLIPACVKTCPAAALGFSDRGKVLATAKTRVEDLKKLGYAEARVYGESELGGLGRVYVLTAPAAAYGLPEKPEYPVLANFWQNLLQPFGYVAVGATALGLGVNWVLTRRARLGDVETVEPET